MALELDDIVPLHLATITFPDELPSPTGPVPHPLGGQTGDVLGFAVRAHSGLVLFDTGLGADAPFIDRYYRPRRTPLDVALSHHGHALADVSAIVNSHLHHDHCGNNPLFPGVPIYAQQQELAALDDPWYTVRDWVLFPGVEYLAVDGEARVTADVRIVPSPGHTRGHQSLVVETRRGPVVLAGQAIYGRRDLDALGRAGEVDDGDEELRSARRLLDLRPVRVHFSHDRQVWDA